MENILFQGEVGAIQIERIERDYSFTMYTKHFHNEYEIYYLLKGERYYFIDKQIYHVKKGSLVFIDRNQIHRTVGAASDYHDRILLLVPREDIAPLLRLCDQGDMGSFFVKNYGIVELNEEGQSYVESLLFSIMDEVKEKRTNYEFLVKTKVVELMVYALRCKSGENLSPIAQPMQTEKHKKINEVAEYIHENYGSSISLSNIADNFYMSKCYLSRIFKEITGFTVNEYINITRIKQAQQLLLHSDYNISQVSEAIGYDSITYFEKVFKKYLECSPLRYRKKYSTR